MFFLINSLEEYACLGKCKEPVSSICDAEKERTGEVANRNTHCRSGCNSETRLKKRAGITIIKTLSSVSFLQFLLVKKWLDEAVYIRAIHHRTSVLIQDALPRLLDANESKEAQENSCGR